MTITELTPRYDSRASFHGKARVKTQPDGTLHLISYTTHVASISANNGTAKVYGTYSDTTLRHIKEFLKQHGFKADAKAQILKDYKETIV